MQSRYNQIIDETSSTGAALSEWYKQHEIEIYDQQGQLLSLYDVLGKVAKIWPTLSKNEQTYYLNQQAGANQTQNLAAILSNFDTAIEATATALDSAGSAAEENSRYMESLDAKVAQLQSTFQQLSSTVVDSELVSTLLDLANNVLTKLNSEAGATVIQWGLLTGVLTGGTVIFGTIASKLIGMIVKIAEVVTGVTTLTASFSTLASVAFPIAGLIAGIAVVGYNLYKNYKKANPTLEEATENLTNLQNELKTNQDRLDEINSIPWYDRTDDIIAEREELMKLNDELKEQIELAEEQQIKAARKVVSEDRTTPTGTKYKVKLNGEDVNIIQDAGYSTKVYITMLAQAVGVQAEFMGSVDRMVEGLRELGYQVHGVSEDIEASAEESNKYYIDSLNNMTSAIKAAQNADLGGAYIDKRIRNYNKEIESLSEVVEAYKLLRDNGEELSDSALELIDAYDEWISTSGQVRDEMAEQDRVANVVANGYVVETEALAKLIAKYPELASATAKANGNSYILADTLIDLAASGDEVAISMAKAAVAIARANAAAAKNSLKEGLQQYIEDPTSITQEQIQGLRDQYNETHKDYQNLLQSIIDGNKIIAETAPEVDYGVSGGGSGSVAGVLDGIKEYLEKEDHKVFLLDKNDQEGNAQAIIDIYKNAQNVIHAYADKLRGLGYAEDSAEIRELQELWWEYQDNIEQVYENIRKIAEEKAAEAEEAWSEALQANIESLQEQQSAYESLFNHMVSNIEEEIAALEEQKNAEEQYWDDKINALEEQNDELDRQLDLEKKMDALAKARQKKVMVYKDGRFQYIEDIDEVSAAQEELDEYNREEALRQEIENLEKLKEEAISNIDDQIEAWEKYKEAWSSIVDDYQKEQDRLLIEQQLGIDIENDNWKERLDNFKSFADEYINAMKELQAAQNEYNQGYQGPTADDYYDDIISSMQPTDNWEYLDRIIRGQSATLPNGRIVRVSIVNGHTQTKNLPIGTVVHTKEGGDWQITGVKADGNYQSQKVNGYASGTLSASGGMSLVGENGPELRVVNSGDGIIPAEITKNLWAWGNFSPGNLIGGLINTLSTMKENSGIIIQNFNPNLSNVTDGESFVAYLQNNFIGDVMQIVHV